MFYVEDSELICGKKNEKYALIIEFTLLKIDVVICNRNNFMWLFLQSSFGIMDVSHYGFGKFILPDLSNKDSVVYL